MHSLRRARHTLAITVCLAAAVAGLIFICGCTPNAADPPNVEEAAIADPMPAGSEEWYTEARAAFIVMNDALMRWGESGIAQVDPAGYWNSWPSGLPPEQKRALLLEELMRLRSLPSLEDVDPVREGFVALFESSLKLADINDRLLELASEGAAGEYTTLQAERNSVLSEVIEQSNVVTQRMEQFVAQWGRPLDWVIPKTAHEGEPLESEDVEELPQGRMWVIVCALEPTREEAEATAERFSTENAEGWGMTPPYEHKPFIVDEASHYDDLQTTGWVVLYQYYGDTEESLMMSLGAGGGDLRHISTTDWYAAEVSKTCGCPGLVPVD